MDKIRSVGMKLFYIEQKGRSMIEMLGVLAIVGILSVGAISGYSTAMRKYKINRLKDEYTQFIHDVLLYDNEWKKMARQNPDVKLFSIQNYVTQMNLLPKLWILDKTGWIIDSMGGQFSIFVRRPSGKIDIDYQTKGTQKSNADAKDLCIAMAYDVFKPMSANVYTLSAYTEKYNDDNKHTGSANLLWYGDSYCGGNRKCLSDLSLSDIITHCTSCAHNDTCRWIIQFE